MAKAKPRESDLDRRRAAIERTRGILADLAPNRRLVDELIADRRSEARSEAQAAAAAGVAPVAEPPVASVLDASALMAHLADEKGAARVREAMEAG